MPSWWQDRGVPQPDHLVFRHSPLGVFAALTLALCATPVASAAPGLALLYLVPLGIVVWVLRTRTTVDSEVISVRGALRTRRVAWSDVTAVRLRSSRTRSGISVVLRGGSELPLPAMRAGDLPRLAAVSGGRLPDPGAGTAPAEDSGDDVTDTPEPTSTTVEE